MDHLAEPLCSSTTAAARHACCAAPRCRRATREALSLAKALAARGHEYERTLDVRAGASLMRTPTHGRIPTGVLAPLPLHQRAMGRRPASAWEVCV